ncbi:UDP-N-acetylmuramoyl-tripeptide--D-alanyl-D-alanine ligase [Actinopolymorpha alba]|uniref:UDP-N-acetylmuramoyl-tripeptide--D-alanyl-D- alanine ligase n=1 Tax=Actinopolymorpha alba TaxID=533267 RepID=UPI0003772E2A|nr:UDP-N-acetylmuramoyl-tripeptide--D-alanyl-D-alanine ligase [Actinopolymorpha alba]
MTLAEIAEAVGGELHGADPEAVVSGPVVADSRRAEPGGLFVADGPGHGFAADAVRLGAVAVLGSRPLPGVPSIAAPAAPGHEVDASVVAVGRLAQQVVDRLVDTTVVAVTGSSGKTSTKDLLAQVLAGAGPTVAPEASLNDELGMPLTVLRAEESTQFLVLEMGAKGVGHIRYLTGIAPPDISVVLNVGLAHAGKFGSREATAAAKGELVEALLDDGLAILNADDELVRAMAGRTSAPAVLVGESADAAVRAEKVHLDEAGRAVFVLVTPHGATDVRLNLVGRHHVGNALSAAAVGLAVGMDLSTVAERLSGAVPRSRWRMEVSERDDGVTIVNDAYNANPDSMRAALQALPAIARGRRSWAVLGEMLELGDASDKEHEAIGRLVAQLGVSRLVVVGEGARAIERGARSERQWGEESVFVPDAEQAFELLRKELRPGDVVLVKSSRDAGLRHLGDALRDGAETVEGRA